MVYLSKRWIVEDRENALVKLDAAVGELAERSLSLELWRGVVSVVALLSSCQGPGIPAASSAF